MNAPLESYQDEIYLNGLGGAKPVLPASIVALEGLARERMPAESFGYICGAAGTEDTVRENAEAFRRWRIVPRMLTDVSAPAYASTVLGTSLAAPMLLGPIGVLKLAHPDGEAAVASAAAAAGIPMILSTASSVTMEEVAHANGDGQRWYQLYWPKDRDVAASLLRRAKAAGFTVLVLTLDTRLLGWRPRDLDNAFLPFLRGIGVQNYYSDPAFEAGVAGQPEQAWIMHWVSMFGDPSLTWDDLPFLRENWDGPIVRHSLWCGHHQGARAGGQGRSDRPAVRLRAWPGRRGGRPPRRPCPAQRLRAHHAAGRPRHPGRPDPGRAHSPLLTRPRASPGTA